MGNEQGHGGRQVTAVQISCDILEEIDSDRIAALIEYIAECADYLITALLPKDAATLSDDYHHIEEI